MQTLFFSAVDFSSEMMRSCRSQREQSFSNGLVNPLSLANRLTVFVGLEQSMPRNLDLSAVSISEDKK